jgi:formylglycine-generating enzyme required for sulfatase activity
MPELITQKRKSTVNYFDQSLHPSNLIINPMKMVLILGGSFDMGSPKTEIDRFDCESPQHEVTVPSFFMSEFLIVQGSWSVVAETIPQVDIPLKRNPSELTLNGENRTIHPVTNINWFEAVEFCQRLSLHSGRTYRLPTEAEWEYACRAGTTTPFYFGETITTDLANYAGIDSQDLEWSGSYGLGSKGIYREQTTPVGVFPPNAFGLYDMHGNAWEWCLDHLHNNYEGAPTDGSAWLSPAHKNASRVLRGGAWYGYPRNCRSATRYDDSPLNHYSTYSFRVVCEIPQMG